MSERKGPPRSGGARSLGCLLIPDPKFGEHLTVFRRTDGKTIIYDARRPFADRTVGKPFEGRDGFARACLEARRLHNEEIANAGKATIGEHLQRKRGA